METIVQKELVLPVIADVDVAVVGGGSAGTAAGIQTARLGLKTLIVERLGSLGGVMITSYMGSLGNTFYNNWMEPTMGGLPREIMERGVADGACLFSDPRKVFQGLIGQPFTVPFNIETMAKVLIDMVEEAGVQLLLNTYFSHVLKGEDGNPYAIAVVNKSGLAVVKAKVIIDASGDADVACNAGAPCQVTPTSFGCLMRIANVDFDKVMAYVLNNDKWESYPQFNQWLYRWWREKKGGTDQELREHRILKHLLDPISFGHAPFKTPGDRPFTREKLAYMKERWEKEHLVYDIELLLLREFLMKAVDAGDLDLWKEIPGFGYVTFNRDGFALGAWGEGIALCNMSQPERTETREDPFAFSRAEMEGRKYAYELARFLIKYVPGFQKAFLMDIGWQFVPRKYRMIEGEKDAPGTIPTTESEVIDDAIYYYRHHSQYSRGHGIPYKILVPKRIDNILVAGKCASKANMCRSIPSCMAMGQAAGCAAQLMIEGRVANRDVDIGKLQKLLMANGVILSPFDGAKGKRRA